MYIKIYAITKYALEYDYNYITIKISLNYKNICTTEILL